MSPIAELALVLAVLFYIEGVRWVPAGTVAFSRRPWGGYSARVPVFLRDRASKGFLLPGFWAPALERVLVTEQPPSDRFDVRRVRQRMRLLRPFLSSAAPLSWLVTSNLFVVGPAFGQVVGWALALPIWLLVQLVLTVVIVRLCVRAARLLPRLAVEARFEALVPLALYPPATARFLESTFARAFHDVDPLAVAAVLVDRDELARMARARLVEEGLDVHSRREIEALLEREGVSLTAVLAPPSRQSDSGCFCPRCRTQYRAGVERCADCRDVTLVPFA